MCSSDLKKFVGLADIVPLEGTKVRVLIPGWKDAAGYPMDDYVTLIGAALLGKDNEYVKKWLNDATRVNEDIAPSLKYFEQNTRSPRVSLFTLPHFTSRLCDY